jgi:hypothetical protein
VSAWRDAQRAFAETDAALTEALARGDKVEATRLGKELRDRALALGTVDPEGPSEETEALINAIEHWKTDETIPEDVRARMIAMNEKWLGLVRKPSA